VIGLQYCHSGRDLLQWGRDLESFNHFGKAIHISGMGFPSSLVPYPGQEKYAFWVARLCSGTVTSPKRFKRTISSRSTPYAYRKPYGEAITYGDFNGIGHDDSIREPRPRNLWVVKGSGLMLTEEAVEFSAGRIEGALILF